MRVNRCFIWVYVIILKRKCFYLYSMSSLFWFYLFVYLFMKRNSLYLPVVEFFNKKSQQRMDFIAFYQQHLLRSEKSPFLADVINKHLLVEQWNFYIDYYQFNSLLATHIRHSPIPLLSSLFPLTQSNLIHFMNRSKN